MRFSDCPNSSSWLTPTRLSVALIGRLLTHVGVGGEIGALEPRPLPDASGLDALADRLGRLGETVVGSFSYSTRGTSTWISTRSRRGPERRFW